MHSCELPGFCIKGILVPLVLCHSLTQVKEVPRKGMGILHRLQQFLVLYRSVTEFALVLGFVAPA